jgi:ketosteroid isomerase-like protein
MKRIVFVATASLATLIALGQMGCSGTNTSPTAPSTTNNNSAKETVDTAAIERELKQIENDWPRVLKERDAAAVKRVEAEDVVMIYLDGTVGSQAQDAKDVETGALSADSWEVTDLKVTVLDNDAAFVSGRSIIKGGKAKTPDGKTMDISGQYRWVDTFARRNGQWKLVASVSTAIKQTEAAPAAAKASPAATKAPPPPSPKPKS